jgi:hypothetical protein
MKKERDPTPEEFEKFLLWLGSNDDGSDSRFIFVQSRLIQIFASRGCSDAESLADEVINRVAVRIDTVVQKYPDPLRCCLGFVDNVYREYLRDEKKKSSAREPPKRRPAEELESEDQCLQQCMGDLEKTEQYLFVQYFGGEKPARKDARKNLREERRLTENALRIQAHRLRKRLHECMRECLGQT